MPYAAPVSLRETLIKYYDDEELRTLCFDLSIDYDSLGGHGKANNARALVAFAQRYDRYDELTAYVRRTRPQAKLAMVEMLPPLADASDGNSATHIYNAPVYQGNIENLATAGGTVSKSDKKIEVKANNIIGNIGDGDFSNEGNIALGDIVLAGQTLPKTREEFQKQLQVLHELLQQAVEDGEFGDKSRDGKKAVVATQEIAEETEEAEPDKLRIANRLTELKARLEGVASVVQAAGKTGTAIVQAAPIVATLIKLAQAVF